MSGDYWHSEVVIYGLIFINMAALLTTMLWAWRRGHLSQLDDQSTGLHPGPTPTLQETRHG
jgi:hypothetical protein